MKKFKKTAWFSRRKIATKIAQYFQVVINVGSCQLLSGDEMPETVRP